jgi:polyphosphate kinase
MYRDYRKLLIAPGNMRDRFVELVRAEAERARNGEEARIVAKMNRLEDPEIVRELYEASRAGVDIDLVVRDICRLRPGLEDLSENITVHSIVGRFLEHARIFYFENAGDPEWYLGSADWMTRNLDYRVEAVTPVEATPLREQLRFILEATLADNRRRWVMQSDGRYERVTPADGEPVRDVQEILMDATDAALERGYGPGLAVDGDLIPGDLLVEPLSETEADSDEQPLVDEASEETLPQSDGGSTSVFERYADHWYRPDSETYDWAVHTADGDTRYFETRDGARNRLREEYA